MNRKSAYFIYQAEKQRRQPIERAPKRQPVICWHIEGQINKQKMLKKDEMRI